MTAIIPIVLARLLIGLVRPVAELGRDCGARRLGGGRRGMPRLEHP